MYEIDASQLLQNAFICDVYHSNAYLSKEYHSKNTNQEVYEDKWLEPDQ